MDNNKTMSLKSAMKLFENLSESPAKVYDVLTALDVIINSDDIAHMSRKGLYNAVLFLVDNIDSLSELISLQTSCRLAGGVTW